MDLKNANTAAEVADTWSRKGQKPEFIFNGSSEKLLKIYYSFVLYAQYMTEWQSFRMCPKFDI